MHLSEQSLNASESRVGFHEPTGAPVTGFDLPIMMDVEIAEECHLVDGTTSRRRYRVRVPFEDRPDSFEAPPDQPEGPQTAS